jgi:SAM-dependent methyltransferase
MVLGLVRTTLRQALDLVDDAGRAPGWAFTDPVILDGWGRGSTVVPTIISNGAPEIGDVQSFLDVGTGVGLLAVAATNVWPDATVVGVDTWEPSLERARVNVAQAGRDDRITLRNQDIADIDDVDSYDCAWVPTFFLPEQTLDSTVAGIVRAVRPGGWIVLGRLITLPDPLADATLALRTIRSGGGYIDEVRSVELLEKAGCSGVRVFGQSGIPMSFTVGQKPEA